MAAIPVGPEGEAIREAYGHVMDGFAQALTTTGLPKDDRDRLRRCYRHAAETAGRRPHDVVRPSPAGEER